MNHREESFSSDQILRCCQRLFLEDPDMTTQDLADRVPQDLELPPSDSNVHEVHIAMWKIRNEIEQAQKDAKENGSSR